MKQRLQIGRAFNVSDGAGDSQIGFTIVEILVSLGILSMLLLSAGTVVMSTATLNAKTNLDARASEAAFQKLQKYVNTSFDNIPLGAVGSAHEVEDFSTAPEVSGLRNAQARVYVTPMSVIDGGATEVTTDHTESSVADTTHLVGSEISASGTRDPTNCCGRDRRLIDNNYFNFVFNNRSPGSANQPLPAIDLGSPQPVDTIRINWFTRWFVSHNFRIEASNDGNNWVTVSSGLSTNTTVGAGIGNYPEDFPVNGTYRFWRMFNVTGVHSWWIAISEMEAFAAASGDVVEQHGSDASVSPGALDFGSSNLEISENGVQGHQSIGLRFKDIGVNQGTAITNAYVQFTANSVDSAAVTLVATGVDVDDASGWNGNYAVDNAVSGVGGTGASTVWNPPGWTAGANGDAQRLNVTGVVQEILNRTGWQIGNSLAIAIQHQSGAGRRVAQKTNAPVLVIEWSQTETLQGGTYFDNNGDGYADNPTLIKVRVAVAYYSFGERREAEFSTYIRQHGIGR